MSGADVMPTSGSVNLNQVGGVAVALGQALMAASLPVTMASNQPGIGVFGVGALNGTYSTVGDAGISGGTPTTESAPANAIGFILEADDANTTNLRWTIGTAVPSATSGMKLQPGRDTGYVPCGHDIKILVESGTCKYGLQWVTK